MNAVAHQIPTTVTDRQTAHLSANRLHLHEGPIDLVIGAEGSPDAVSEAYRRAGAGAAFEGMGSALERWQPLVRRHPETGARALFVTGHAFEVEGMDAREGRALVEALVGVCTEEERVYRHRWCPGDVLIWDNRSVLHRAQGFDERHRRVMHHVRVAGTQRVAS